MDTDRDRGFSSIDWDALWQAESARSGPRNDRSPKELWDKRAATFGKKVNRRRDGEPRDRHDYISLMLERIEVRPGWTVLDIGCGPGILAIPLARRAASVTALDLSSEMLRQLQSRADGLGLTNIRYVNSSWEEAFAGGGVDSHDIVIASRSLMSGDVRKALSHIADVTGEAAYITSPIVHLPLDWEACAAIGRGNRRHAPYIYLYNMLFQMGIQANIEVLRPKVRVEFHSIEEAVDDLQWRTDPFSPDEKARLREFLKGRLAEQGDPPIFTHEGQSRWALIWWQRRDQ